MKKLLTVIMMLLAINFLAAAGGVGWLWRTGKLDRAKLMQMRDLVFPPPAPAQSPQASSSSAATQPTFRLDELMARQTGHSALEQVDFIRRTFDARMLELDRRQRELQDLQQQVDLANQKLALDRAALTKQQQELAARQQEADKLQNDKGFQDTLALYNAMPAKKVKEIFVTLNESTVQQYLDAMEPRTAARVIKEFKTPEETAFIQRVLERIRQSQATTAADKQP